MDNLEIEKRIKQAFSDGYELGHHNTVEGWYCGGEQASEDYMEEIKTENNLQVKDL